MCQRNNIEGGLLINEQNGHQSLYMFSAMMKGHISSHVDSTKNVGEDKIISKLFENGIQDTSKKKKKN